MLILPGTEDQPEAPSQKEAIDEEKVEECDGVFTKVGAAFEKGASCPFHSQAAV